MRTAIYARKSSESEDRQIQSIDDQLNNLKGLAKREGIRIDEVFTEAKSAKEPYVRPQFQRLVEAIQNGEVEQILTWSMNRLSRNLVDGGLVAHLLQLGKLKAIYTIDRVYRPEDNALLLSIENGMATSFIQDLTRNVKRGMAGKIDRGWYPGRPPLGYLNNPITREIDVDPVRFPIVRKAWDMLLTGGLSVAEIHREVVRTGLTSYNPNRTLKPFARSAIYALFTNPFYAATFRFQGALHRGKHVPMISEAEFARAQAILGRKLDRRPQRLSFLFGGVLRCGVCGCQIVAHRSVKTYTKTDRAVTYTYYHCTNGKGGCRKVGIREADLESGFQNAFDRIEIPTSFGEWAITEANRHLEAERSLPASRAVVLSQKIGKNEARRVRLRSLLLDGDLGPSEYAELKASIETELERDRDLVRKLDNEDDLVLALVAEKLNLAAEAHSYQHREDHRKRGMIQSLGGPHYLTLGKLHICLHPIVQKIAGIEPLRIPSEMPKPGDSVALNSKWYSFTQDILKIARENVVHERDSS